MINMNSNRTSYLASIAENRGFVGSDAFPDLLGHLNTLFLATISCQVLVSLSSKVSFQFSDSYRCLSPWNQDQWNIRVVCVIHALLSCIFSFLSINNERKDQDTLFGYSWFTAQYFSISIGFFLWDTLISAIYYSEYGAYFLMHAIGCLIAYFGSLYPFAMYYGARFMLFELSTPFLHFHWFLDKTGNSGSLYQWINGFMLVNFYFWVRLVFGIRLSCEFVVEIITRSKEILIEYQILYCSVTVLLNILNIIWFKRMAKTFYKRITIRQDSKRT